MNKKKELIFKIVKMITESIKNPEGWSEYQEQELQKLIKELNETGDALKEVWNYKLNTDKSNSI